jgi:RNA:NAD 2'-phosphotransferase (TPT1/KptA family)
MSLENYIRSELFSARKGFEIGSKVLYHNGKWGATENFDQIKYLVEKCNKGRFNLNIYI